MCCIFTCCGWMIDLVQRLWTFTMSCCISSAVCCVMLTSSMSGIALGYNYSLAEYIDLKETNVSVYLKRGVFDDEIADDMDWRRAARMPVAGHINENNLVTGGDADQTVNPFRSGRRLDDSVFEADDQNKYEGSLMKLTAKPPYQNTEPPQPTPDNEIGQLKPKLGVDPNDIGRFVSAVPELDQLKAIKSLLDSRRAMNAGRTTLSPVATYSNIPFINFPMYANPGAARGGPESARRMPSGFGPGPGSGDFGPGSGPIDPKRILNLFPGINPARFAVPDHNIGAAENWALPKKPELVSEIADMGPDYVISATYPPPITVRAGPATTPAQKNLIPEGALVMVTRTLVATKPRADVLREQLQKELEPYEKGEEPRRDYSKDRSGGARTSEEEYEDEIKGLPVRKRRSIKRKTPVTNEITGITTNKVTDTTKSDLDVGTKVKDDLTSITIEATSYVAITENNDAKINNYTSHVIQGANKNENNDSQTHVPSGTEKNNMQSIDNLTKPNSNNSFKAVASKQSSSEPLIRNNLLDRLISTVVGEKVADIAKRSIQFLSDKNKRRRKSFESEIISSKSKPRLMDTEAATIKTPELVDSISVQLNEGNLLKNPKSNFVKLLKSTFA